MLCDVIGEVHDNVASHARGIGFSAAQVYRSRIQFAIADSGQGFLRTSRKANAALSNNHDAIEWCLGEENTSAIGAGEFSQKADGQDPFEVFSSHVAVRTTKNHHQGLGLYKLRRCVEAAHGSLVLVSGDGAVRVVSNGRAYRQYPPSPWSGVFIEFELPSSAVLPSDDENSKLEELKSFLGWTG